MRLTLRGVYILPTGVGLVQMLAWILLVTASLNFNLGVMLLLALLLGAVALVSMVETVRNLAGLDITLDAPAPTASGQRLPFLAHLRATDGRPRSAVEVRLRPASAVSLLRARRDWCSEQIDVPSDGGSVVLMLPGGLRGRLAAGRICIESRWPLGLFRAWRSWTPDAVAIIHPAPLQRNSPPLAANLALPRQADQRDAAQAQGASLASPAEGDFVGHRRAQPGESLLRIDWRATLRARQWLSPEHRKAQIAEAEALRWEDEAPALDEIRLSRLTARVLELSRKGQAFSLSLPGQLLSTGAGRAHRDQALTLLADHPVTAAAPRPAGGADDETAGPGAARAEIPRAQILGWTGGMVAAALPLAMQLPWSASLPWALLVSVRLILVLLQQAPLSGTVLTVASGLASLLIYAQYHTLLGRDPGMALLLVMAGLKLLELRRPRDLHMLCVLALFLLLSAQFNNQSALLAAWNVMVLLWLLLRLVEAHQAGRMPSHTRTVLRLVLPAVPLAVLLFVLFPRPEHALWGAGMEPENGSGGLSDHMSPGSISHLRLSEHIAFRAHFGETWPQRDQLYWRGPVLENFDGHNWTTINVLPVRRVSARHSGQAIDYVLEPEPSESSWLFALELIENRDSRLNLDGNGVVHLGGATTSLRSWNLRAWPRSHLDVDSTLQDQEQDLQLPDTGNPQARALAASWRGLAPLERLHAAERAFLQARLQYSLDVPLAGDDPVDELLFGHHTGYCEHFSSAFAFLLRAAGVPARVVTGYQGGERNPLGDYLIVRQSDAHAWVEAWIAGQGWLRVDPTALTLPDRVFQGAEAAVPLPAPSWMPPFVVANRPLWHRVQLMRDLATVRWHHYVANLGAQEQRELMESLGLGRVPPLQLAAFCAILVSVGIGLQLLLGQRRRHAVRRRGRAKHAISPLAVATTAAAQSRWERHWRTGEQILRLAGLSRRRDEGPADWLHRLAQTAPSAAATLRRWGEPCLQARFAPARTIPSGPGLAGMIALVGLAGQLLRLRLLGQLPGRPAPTRAIRPTGLPP